MPTEISGSTGVNKIQDNTIVNADINSSAAIAGSKLVMPTGSILQVVQNTYGSAIATTSTSYGATGLYVDITPSSTSSKIYVMTTTPGETNGSGQSGYFTFFREISGSDVELANKTRITQASSGGSDSSTQTMFYLDSPNTTSLCRYRLKMLAGSGSTIVSQRSTTLGVAVAMEIAG
jgi:hypothetical protein